MSEIRHLRALQAFDAAATLSSLSKAAEALGVTHGAVSRQIKQLEAYPFFLPQLRKVGLRQKPEGDLTLYVSAGRSGTEVILANALVETVVAKQTMGLNE